ncbi:MAG: MAPEG family protein [Vulcanococcus sp.]
MPLEPAFAWSLLLAAGVVVASLVPLGAARSQADFTIADLAAPRAMAERLPEWGKRANWAHQNGFEAFTLFAPAALLCLVAHVSAPAAIAAAWIHPGLRLAYIGAYVANQPPLRSLCWAGAITCTGILYLEGIKAVLASAS